MSRSRNSTRSAYKGRRLTGKEVWSGRYDKVNMWDLTRQTSKKAVKQLTNRHERQQAKHELRKGEVDG